MCAREALWSVGGRSEADRYFRDPSGSNYGDTHPATQNFFGEQRFGAAHSSVHGSDIGLRICRGEWLAALKLALGPDTAETNGKAARAQSFFAGDQHVSQENVQEAIRLMPIYKTRERLMLKALHR